MTVHFFLVALGLAAGPFSLYRAVCMQGGLSHVRNVRKSVRPSVKRIGRVSYLIYVSMRHYVLTTSGDIVVCFHTAVCLSC